MALAQKLFPLAAQSMVAIPAQSFTLRTRSAPPRVGMSRISALVGARIFLASASVLPFGDRVQL